MKEEIPDKNLFMICKKLNLNALSELPNEYHVRTCRRDELAIWKAIHFDDPRSAKDYETFMTKYFNDVYADKESLFFQKCLFVMKTILLSGLALHGNHTKKSVLFIGSKL